MAVAPTTARFLDHLWADWSPGYDAAWDLARVKEAIGDPANLAAAIGYYRAVFDPALRDPGLRRGPGGLGVRRPRQPTLYLHGTDDGAHRARRHRRRGVGAVAGFGARDGRRAAGHFLHLEQPDPVGRDTSLRFLGA